MKKGIGVSACRNIWPVRRRNRNNCQMTPHANDLPKTSAGRARLAEPKPVGNQLLPRVVRCKIARSARPCLWKAGLEALGFRLGKPRPTGASALADHAHGDSAGSVFSLAESRSYTDGGTSSPCWFGRGEYCVTPVVMQYPG